MQNHNSYTSQILKKLVDYFCIFVYNEDSTRGGGQRLNSLIKGGMPMIEILTICLSIVSIVVTIISIVVTLNTNDKKK